MAPFTLPESPEPTSPDLAAAIQEEQKKLFQSCYQMALDRISRKEQSATELKRYLIQKNVPTSVLPALFDRLQEGGWIDDTRFAKIYVRYQTQRNKGPLWIKNRLLQKGISLTPLEIKNLQSEFYLSQSDSSEDPDTLPEYLVESHALAWLTKKYPSLLEISQLPRAEKFKLKNRAYAACLRQGHSHDVTQKILQSLLQSTQETPEDSPEE